MQNQADNSQTNKKRIAFIVKLLTPYISTLAGVIATWLIVHIHFLGLFHSQAAAAKVIASALVLILVTVLTWITAHTKIIPDIEKWAGPIIHDLDPQLLEASHMGVAPAVVVNPVAGATVNLHTSPAAVAAVTPATSAASTPPKQV